MKNTSLKLSDVEKSHLDQYCELTERTLSDVLRQYIRSLSIEGVQCPLDRLTIPPDADSASTARDLAR